MTLKSCLCRLDHHVNKKVKINNRNVITYIFHVTTKLSNNFNCVFSFGTACVLVRTEFYVVPGTSGMQSQSSDYSYSWISGSESHCVIYVV
jgi:hypothetical protein